MKAADGGVDFTDARGEVVSRVAAPVAWDGAVDERSGERSAQVPVSVTVVQRGVGRAVLTFSVDRGWALSPEQVFPITVDPTYASSRARPVMDTFVQSGSSANNSASTELKVGTFDGGVTKARAYLNFANEFRGKSIVSAQLSLYETHAWSCTKKPVRVYRSEPASSSVTWATQPVTGGTASAWVDAAKGYSSSCAAGRISLDIKGRVGAWVRILRARLG